MPIITTTIPSSGGNYALRRDVELTDEELKEIDDKSYEEHNRIMTRCIIDAKTQSRNTLNPIEFSTIASALFAMRARPIHYIREEAAREKWLAQQKAKKPICAPAQDNVKMDLSNL